MKIDIETANMVKRDLERVNERLKGKAFESVTIHLRDTGLVLEVVDPDPEVWIALEKAYGVLLVKVD